MVYEVTASNAPESRMPSWRSILLPTLLVAAGCATLQQIAALRQVDFALERIAEVRLAGVDLDRVRSYSDLTVTDVARLTLALSEDRLPLAFELIVQGENPADNGVDARLVRFDWTLLLEDRETVSGVFDREVVFAPGQPTTFPLAIELDLVEFFEGNARDLADLALSLSGQGGRPRNVALRATPTISTALGPIRYPGAITVVSVDVGDDRDR
jgi:hypothetical protein